MTLEEEGGLTRTQQLEKQLKLKYVTLQKTLRSQGQKATGGLGSSRGGAGAGTGGGGGGGFVSKLSIHRDQEKVLEQLEEERKSGMFTRSILRTKSHVDSDRGAGTGAGAGAGGEEEEAELSKAVVNYQELCNDIYICDWQH
jgi:hypothetical protein